MTSDNPAILGIDLDITHVAAAELGDDGHARILPNADGEDVTPAYVHLFDADGVAVGDEARRMLAVDRTLVVEDVCIHLGAAGWHIEAFERAWTAQELVGLLLRKVREDVSELRNMPFRRALLAVPAWFDSARRQAAAEAAAIAEIDVASMVNQPIAAALGAGVHLLPLEGNVLMLDIGGRDTEIGLIEKRGEAISLRASSADFRTSVRSFEVRVRRHLLDAYREASGGALPNDPRLAQQIYDASRVVLSTLATRPMAATRLQSGGIAVPTQIDRPTLARVSDDLLATLDQCVDAFLAEADRSPDNLAAVVLVGCGARIPMIRDRLRARYRSRLHEVPDPDRAIARGAALLGALRHAPDHPGLRAPRRSLPARSATPRRASAAPPSSPDSRFKARLGLADGGTGATQDAPRTGSFQVQDATTQTLGLIALDRQRRERVVPLIREGTPLPCEFKGRFTYAYTGMTAVRVEITEGRGVLREDVQVIGIVELRGLPPRPVGTPIEIVYAYGANQVLKVDVVDVETGTRRRVDIAFRGGLSDDQIRSATRRANEIHRQR